MGAWGLSWRVRLGLGVWCALVAFVGVIEVALKTDGATRGLQPARPKDATGSMTITSAPTTTAARPQRLLVAVGSFPDTTAPTEVHSLAPDGTDERIESVAVARLDQVSPRGDRVVFAKDQGSGEYQGCGVGGCSRTTTSAAGIVFANRDGTSESVVTQGGYDWEPRWSPAGDLIAYTSHRRRPDGTDYYTIAFLDPGGRPVGSISTPAGVSDQSVAFSPNGREVAFIRFQPDSTPVVMISDIRTGETHAIAEGEYQELSWSPDGHNIAGVAYGPDRMYRNEVWVVPVDGSAARKVYTAPRANAGVVSRYLCGATVNNIPEVRSPLWSPDSSTLAFLSNAAHLEEDSQSFDMLVVGADGANVRERARGTNSSTATL